MIRILSTLHEAELGSVADNLPWSHGVSDGIIATKRGGFMSSFAINGPDGAATSAEEREFLSAKVDEALQRLSNQRTWVAYSNLFRVPSVDYPENGWFPSRISRLIDAERKQSYNDEGRHFESRYVVTLMHMPFELNGKTVENYKYRSGGLAAQTLANFQSGVEDFCRTLAPYLNIRRLGQREIMSPDGTPILVDEHLSFLRYCLNGSVYPVLVPQSYRNISSYLSTDAFVNGDEDMMLGEKYVSVIGIGGMPAYTQAALFAKLDSFAIPMRMSLRGILLDKKQALAEIKYAEQTWGGATVGFLSSLAERFGGGPAKVNTAAASMENQSTLAYHNVELDKYRHLLCTFNVTLIGENRDQVLDNARDVVAALNDLGFPASIESVAKSRAFFGTMPGDVFSNLSRPNITTKNFAHMLPITGVWPGIDRHPSNLYPPKSPPIFYGRTTGTAPFRFSTHAQDSNGHVLLQGPSGGGKSTFLSFLVSQHERYRGAQAAIIDRDRALYPLAKAMEIDGIAKHYEFDPDDPTNSTGFCPFAHIGESAAEREYALSFIEMLLHLNGVTPTIEHRGHIREAINVMADPRMDKSLSAFAALVQDMTVKQVVQDYVRSEAGRFLDAEHDPSDEAPFQFYEVRHIVNMEDRLKLPIFRHILHINDRRLREFRPTMLVLDEAWMYFKDDYMSKAITELLKVSRKKNLSIIFATQSLKDIGKDNPLAATVLQECLTKVFLPNFSAAQNDSMRADYASFGLSDYEVDLIARNLKRKSDYYYTSPVGRRPFSLDLTDFSLLFLGAEAEKIAEIERLSAADPKNWVYTYCSNHGQRDWGELWRSMHAGEIAA